MKIIEERHPLILSITNYVAMNFTANALLAAGASPVMSSCPEEIAELTGLADALVINIGCIDPIQAKAMEIASRAASEAGKRWVLDPAGAGASRFRMDAVTKLLEHHPSILRGNASEIMAIAGKRQGQRGVDSDDDSLAAAESAESLARRYGTVVCVSGRTDLVTSGDGIFTIEGGHPIMSKVTAMGCVASALAGAFAAVIPDPVEAAGQAAAAMKKAGEKAAAKSQGPGSFQINFIDELHRL